MPLNPDSKYITGLQTVTSAPVTTRRSTHLPLGHCLTSHVVTAPCHAIYLAFLFPTI